MKKLFCAVLSLVMILSLFTGCKDNITTDNGEKDVIEETITAWLIATEGNTEYVYDENANCIKKIYTNADGKKDEYEITDSYDKNGNITTNQDGGGVGFYEVFNDKSDMTGFIVFTNGQIETYDYMYDSNDRILTKIHYMNGEYREAVEYTYTPDGKIATELQVTLGSWDSTEYFYNAEGLTETEIRYINDKEQSRREYYYDENNRLVKIIEKFANGKDSVAAEYEYDSEGNYIEKSDFNITKYDKHGNLICRLNKNGDIISPVFTYIPVEVTPIRAKAIERYKDRMYYWALQR